MNFIVELKRNKLIDNAGYMAHLRDLEDGKYLISVKQLNALKTPRDYQNEYNALVDECARETGNSRRIIHEEFKVEASIPTTRKQDIESWIDILDKFKYFALNKMNLTF